MATKKTVEPSTPSPDFTLIAIALASMTINAFRSATLSAEYEVGDLVVNISDVFFNEGCLDRVGTVLEIRDDAIEIRRLDGVGRCAIAKSGTYLAAKGGGNVPA
jgi:hypothetical protein